MSTEQSKDEPDRFAESTNLKWGVVEDSIPEKDVYRHDENPVFITRFNDEYSLHIGSRVGVDSTIHFESLSWDDGTLFFKKTVSGSEVFTGHLDWHPVEAGHDFGLVGEWFLEQLDLGEYRTEIECPNCGGSVLRFRMFSGCENTDCDFIVEGWIQED